MSSAEEAFHCILRHCDLEFRSVNSGQPQLGDLAVFLSDSAVGGYYSMMDRQTDQQLLAAYAERRCEAAFAELVRRHIDLVYSAALRMVREAHLAQDVTQGVFLALARNARHLTECTVLSGWLHRAARNLAANAVRSEARRRAREREAAAMHEFPSAEPDMTWDQVAPHLDAALGELSEPEREALLLRYFERKSAREMAELLSISDDAAQKRVNRAVERLRGFFGKRGVTIGSAGLVAALSAKAVQAAPAGLDASVSAATVLAHAGLRQAAAITTTKVLAMTTMQKTLIIGALTLGLGSAGYQMRQVADLQEEVRELRRQQAPLRDNLAQLRRQLGDAERRAAASEREDVGTRRNNGELLRLRGEVSRLRAEARELAQWKSTHSDDALDSTMKSWLGRANQLKLSLDLMPNSKIPELKLLKEDDWLSAARDAKFDTDADTRKSLATVWNAAEEAFLNRAQEALKKYQGVNGGQFPTDVAQLQPFFDPPLDAAMLSRWQIAPASTVPNLGVGDPIITQKGPVGAEWAPAELRLVIGAGGGKGATSPATEGPQSAP